MSDHCEISGARLPRPGRGESLSMDEAAAFRAGAEAMREAAACAVDCGCKRAADVVAEAAVHGGNSSLRWALCGDPRCGALEAAAIRALPLPEPPASLQADGLCGRGA